MENENRSSSGFLNQSVMGNWGNEDLSQAIIDFNNMNPVPSTQIQTPDFMSIPPYMLPQYNQAADEEKQAIQLFWQQQLSEIGNTEATKGQHRLPLARIKRIMKADSDVKMISAETPLVLSKACEIFIQELSLRAWMRTEQNKRRTIQRCDIAKAISQNNVFDFLADVVPMKEHHQQSYPPHDHTQDQDSGKIAEGTQVTQPYAASTVDDAIMNMGIDQQGAGSQQFSQSFIMQPLVLSSQFPYNFPPN